ncbi:hypothetical protein KR009_006415 [Drosophila setifemur]|nr:hypothetical protein KR009_006415 [Drosophila setifemur]
MNFDQTFALLQSSGKSQAPKDPAPVPDAWPREAQLHQPPERSQLLLAERCSGLAVRAYLKFCRLPFCEKISQHAEFMSPGGRLTRLPLLRLGPVKVFSEFEPIVAHVEGTQLEHSLSSWLGEEEREDMRSAVSYVENTFSLAEIHMSFQDAANYQLYTGPRSGAAHPWPLSLVRRYAKQREAMRLLKVYQWQDMDTDQVLHEMGVCCSSLSSKMEENEGRGANFLYGEQPCELDALVFGHVTSILTTRMPNMELADLLHRYPRLIAHSRRIDTLLFQGRMLIRHEEGRHCEDEEDDQEEEQ